MSTLTITINLDNDAFQGASAQYEIERILRDYANRVGTYGAYSDSLLDINGNTAGKAEVLP